MAPYVNQLVPDENEYQLCGCALRARVNSCSSDHVLNGIRLAAKRGVVDRDDIRLHFFTRRRTGEIDVESPVVDADGRLSRWPAGFFDQWDRDLDELLD